MKTLEQYKQEGKLRGIVPGALVTSEFGVPSSRQHHVKDYSQWGLSIDGNEEYDGTYEAGFRHWIYSHGVWATVLTPAPDLDTLQPNDACECSKIRIREIFKIAKQRGFSTKETSTRDGGVVFLGLDEPLRSFMLTSYTDNTSNKMIPSEFIRKLKNTCPIPTIAGCNYTITKDGVSFKGIVVSSEDWNRVNDELKAFNQ